MGVDREGGREGQEILLCYFRSCSREKLSLAMLVSFLSRECGCIAGFWDPGSGQEGNPRKRGKGS